MSEGQSTRKIGQILLIVGAIVLALLIGILIGRRGEQPDLATQPAPGVQISTEEPPARPSTPLVAPVQAPPAAPAAPVAKLAPDDQVQEDAAAVGMTTRDEPAENAAPAEPEPATPTPAPSADPPAN